MNDKRGFTTMGFVAVIVVLAILILIGTPVVSNLMWRVNRSKSIKMTSDYIKDINVAAEKYQADNNGKKVSNFDEIKENVESSVTPTYVLTVNFDDETGTVARAIFRMKDKFNCTYENNKIICDQYEEMKHLVIGNNLNVDFINGMTWGKCMKTSYCSSLFSIYGEDDMVRIKFGLFNPEPEMPFVKYNGEEVKLTDQMIPDGNYTWGNK